MTTVPEFDPKRYDKMPYRHCGHSGLKLPLISLGFWQKLGEPGMEEECRRCMHYALDHGITHFDLANNYGPPAGNSELVVGKYLREMPRDELVISTKAGHWMWPGPYGDGGSKKSLIASLDQSLKRLGLDYVDIFYHHRPDSDTPVEETMAALNLIVRQGKALYVGVSKYSGHKYAATAELIRERGWSPITIHQPYYNMLDREIEGDLLPNTQRCGAGVIAFCPLAGGMVTERYLKGVPADSRHARDEDGGQRWWNELKERGVWDKLGQLTAIAHERGQTLAQMALAWTVRLPAVTSALIGVSSVEQLKDNVGAIDNLSFSDEELKRIDTVLAKWPR